MKLSRRFEGQVALITGGGSGLGEAAAIRLAQEGASIGVAGRRAEMIHKVRQEIESLGSKAIDIKCDVTQESDCKHMVEQVVNEFGRLDVLVTSAGIHGGGETVVDTSVEVWEKVINTDLKGAYLSSKFSIPQMREAGGGAIIHVSSIGGMRGSPQGMAFQSAKGGVINLTRHMAVAHAPENIRVNCICPGVITTPLTKQWLSDPTTYNTVCEMHPMNRIGKPEEFAAAVAFLASNEALFITGAILPVDGGYLAAGRE
ncbi:MAG: glucose 1-dehydrogenase [Trichodesmium sp. MO_231.B1]|nr:glucose 1-dehydrogenase [Trichodesmium sp. MO_231.B1]